jgi:oxysterol-binding protein-related protein 9/10/11
LLIFCAHRFIGVADLAAVRFSLPSQLLEPTPNLEYWNYLDSPNAFIAIGTADDPVDRMLEVLRFWFTKDLKYAKGKPCKPYNSCLGEFFRVCWGAALFTNPD